MSRILSTDHLVLASHNAGKLSEMQELFLPYNFRLSSISDYGLGEPIEDGKTFEENAYKKASVAAKQTGEVVLSDDSGICVESLGNAPGIYTANWAETPDSDTRDFSLAMRRVEEELQLQGALTPETRKAYFCAVLCLCWPDGEAEYFRGEVHGQIVNPPRGELGFGYDPIFQPDGHTRTFGEMTSEEKHGMNNGAPLSHRSRAFTKLIQQHLS